MIIGAIDATQLLQYKNRNTGEEYQKKHAQIFILFYIISTHLPGAPLNLSIFCIKFMS